MTGAASDGRVSVTRNQFLTFRNAADRHIGNKCAPWIALYLGQFRVLRYLDDALPQRHVRGVVNGHHEAIQ